jgi:hypothetical protein
MDINETLERIITLYNSGGNPQQVMQQMMQKNPQVGQVQSQLQNMAQGRNPAEFILQLAKQNGASEQNLQGLAKILNAKH